MSPGISVAPARSRRRASAGTAIFAPTAVIRSASTSTCQLRMHRRAVEHPGRGPARAAGRRPRHEAAPARRQARERRAQSTGTSSVRPGIAWQSTRRPATIRPNRARIDHHPPRARTQTARARHPSPGSARVRLELLAGTARSARRALGNPPAAGRTTASPEAERTRSRRSLGTVPARRTIRRSTLQALRKFSPRERHSRRCRHVTALVHRGGTASRRPARVEFSAHAMAFSPSRHRNWTDSIFRRIRKLAGYEAAVTILVTAEMIGFVYYRALARATDSPSLKIHLPGDVRRRSRAPALRRRNCVDDSARQASAGGAAAWSNFCIARCCRCRRA